MMENSRVFGMPFASVYPHYMNKAERKGQSREEVVACICWLTGCTQDSLQKAINEETGFETFFAEAPQLHPYVLKMTGVICGDRVEETEDSLMQKIHYLDKLSRKLSQPGLSRPSFHFPVC